MKKDQNKTINEIVKLIDTSGFSSIKQVVSGIIRIIDDPESTAKDLKDIIELDPPLASKVLKIANSAYYSIQREVGAIEQAVILIGFNAIKELALSLKVCEIFDSEDPIEDYTRASLWKHSVAVALLSKMIYKREFREKGENIYIAGLLHEIGIIAEDQFIHSEFKKILNKTKVEKKNLNTAETEVLGYHHAEVGRAITDYWKFPREIIMGIGFHHNPTHVPKEFYKIASTLYVADCLCQERNIGYCDAPLYDQALFQESLEMLDITKQSLDLIIKEMESEISKIEDQGLFI